MPNESITPPALPPIPSREEVEAMKQRAAERATEGQGIGLPPPMPGTDPETLEAIRNASRPDLSPWSLARPTGDNSDLAFMFPYVSDAPTVEPASASDKFIEQLLQNPLVNAGRAMAASGGLFGLSLNDIEGTFMKAAQGSPESTAETQDILQKMYEENRAKRYTVSKELEDDAKKRLGETPEGATALEFAKNWAKDDEGFKNLVQMKVEDIARTKRVEAAGWDSGSFAGAAGFALALATDPLTWAGGGIGAIGKAASAAKIANAVRLEKAVLKSKVLQAVSKDVNNGLAGGALIGANAYANEKLGGFHQDYVTTVALGSAAGFVLPHAIGLLGKAERQVYKGIGELVTDVKIINRLQEAMEKLPIGEKPHVAQVLRHVKDLKAVEEHTIGKTNIHLTSETIQRLHETGSTVISRKNAAELMESLGLNFNYKSKVIRLGDALEESKMAHYDYSGKPSETPLDIPKGSTKGQTLIIKENMDSEEQLTEWLKDIKLGRIIQELPEDQKTTQGIKKLFSADEWETIKNQFEIQKATDDEVAAELLSNSKWENPEGLIRPIVVDGLVYTGDNLFNPQRIMNLLDSRSPFVWAKREIAKHGKSILDRSRLFGDVFSVMKSSQSSTLSKITEELLENPLGTNTTKSAEFWKNSIESRVLPKFHEYLGIESKVVSPFDPFRERKLAPFRMDVAEYFGYTYGNQKAGIIGREFSNEVKEAAAKINEIRELELEIGKNLQKITGGRAKDLIEAKWEAIENDFTRVLDDDKLVNFIRTNGTEKSIEKLTEYYKVAANRESIAKLLELRIKNAEGKGNAKNLLADLGFDVEKIAENYKKAMTAARGGETKATDEAIAWPEVMEFLKRNGVQVSGDGASGSTQIIKMKIEVTDELIDRFIEKDSKEWATGIVKHHGNTEMTLQSLLDDPADKLNDAYMPNFRRKAYLDTSTTLNFADGSTLCFNRDLRDVNIPMIMGKQIQRFAGECGLATINDLEGLQKSVVRELSEAVAAGKTTKNEAEKDMRAFRYALDRIRGINKKEVTALDQIAGLLNDTSFMQNSGNLFINQIGEMGGHMAYAGGSAVIDCIPGLGRLFRQYRFGKIGTEAIEEARLDLFGRTARDQLYGTLNTLTSRRFNNPIMNGISRGTRWLSSPAGTALQALTNRMRYAAQSKWLTDLAQWANGKEFSTTRNPFRKYYLDRIGVDDRFAFREKIAGYIKTNTKGLPESFDFTRMRTEDPELFASLRQMGDRFTNRCLTDSDGIGGTNLAKATGSPFWKVFFMFKDFTMRATKSQTMRALNDRQADDILAGYWDFVWNSLVYAGLTHARAAAKYGDNPAKERQYKEARLNPRALAWAGFFRSPRASGLSYVNDSLEMLGMSPAPTIRTTVSRDEKSAGNIFTAPGKTISNAVEQLPGFQAGRNVLTAAGVGLQSVSERQLTQSNFNKIWRALPMNNAIIACYLQQELAETRPK